MVIDPSEPAQITLASGEEVEVIRIGATIGLGAASSEGAVMVTLYPAEAARIAAELARAAADG
jgi:hypothetical protein